jgi:hypothetical protein
MPSYAAAGLPKQSSPAAAKMQLPLSSVAEALKLQADASVQPITGSAVSPSPSPSPSPSLGSSSSQMSLPLMSSQSENSVPSKQMLWVAEAPKLPEPSARMLPSDCVKVYQPLGHSPSPSENKSVSIKV